MILVDELMVNYKLKFIDSTVFAHGLLLKKIILKNFLELFYQNSNFCSWSLSFYTKYKHTVHNNLTSFLEQELSLQEIKLLEIAFYSRYFAKC